ncbi:glycosyltransferase [Candidatus Parcubacteria bacterium]|nr:glycosyltransferase [Patescibacteria group bacterium]MBU4380832.1 glycosyltransferase [Patescibacteria group bacterium]MCG2689497.1 glycosyltransferase [Candidatus Parcubacteria bacterium]
MENPKIAHIKPVYLEKTEIWVWEYIRNLTRYDPFIICEVEKNLDLFPFKPIYKIDPAKGAKKALGSVVRAFIPRHLAVEEAMAQVISRNKPALIHAHFGSNGVYSAPLSSRFGIPLVTSFYGFDTSYQGLADKMRKFKLPTDRFYWELAYKRLWEVGSAFTVTCQLMKDTLVNQLGAPADKVIPLHLGMNLDKYHLVIKKPTTAPVILIANRFVPKKGMEYAVSAFAKVLTQYPNATLRIIGDGSEKEKITALVNSLGITDSVKFLGLLGYNDYMAEMQKADLFLSPSVKVLGDEEGGINTTIIEAMAVGTHAFATTESGTELIYHEKTGHMVNQRDANDLADKIVSFLKSPNLWEMLAKSARKHVEEEFDNHKQGKRLEEIYDHVRL